MVSFMADGKTVSVFPAEDDCRPLVCLHTFGREGEDVYQILREAGQPDFSLVAVSGLDWNHDMAPWDIPPLSEKDRPCTGGAEDYLKLLTGKILPEAEKAVKGQPSWRGIAGYSLAGLFAIYALYRTDRFSRAASVSGSLWFPGFREYVFTHEPMRKPDCLYFSLGDREHRTRNRFLKSVRENTEEIERFCRSKGIPACFQLNPGNHFQDAAARTAAGIAWILNR